MLDLLIYDGVATYDVRLCENILVAVFATVGTHTIYLSDASLQI